jgi:hypothetical protein
MHSHHIKLHGDPVQGCSANMHTQGNKYLQQLTESGCMGKAGAQAFSFWVGPPSGMHAGPPDPCPARGPARDTLGYGV